MRSCSAGRARQFCVVDSCAHHGAEGARRGTVEGPVVALGDALVETGVAAVGPVQLGCDGEHIHSQVWGAGAALGGWLLGEAGRALLRECPEVVELGAGTGVAGLCAGAAGAASVLLTDLQQAVPTIERSVEANRLALGRCEVRAAELQWGDMDRAFELCPSGADLIIGADLLYNPEIFDQLLATVSALAAARDARVLIAAEQRWDHVGQAWWEALERSEMELVAKWELPADKRLPRPVWCSELHLAQ